MEEAFVGLLLADSGVASALATRVWWGRAPQSKAALPYCVVTRISGRRDNHMTGPSGLVESRIQINCYADTYTSAKTAARAVQAAVNGYRGTFAGKQFQGAFIDGERDLPNESEAGAARFAVSFDLRIWHD